MRVRSTATPPSRSYRSIWTRKAVSFALAQCLVTGGVLPCAVFFFCSLKSTLSHSVGHIPPARGPERQVQALITDTMYLQKVCAAGTCCGDGRTHGQKKQLKAQRRPYKTRRNVEQRKKTQRNVRQPNGTPGNARNASCIPCRRIRSHIPRQDTNFGKLMRWLHLTP